MELVTVTDDRVQPVARELRSALDSRLDVDRLRPLVVRAGRIARAGTAGADLLDALIVCQGQLDEAAARLDESEGLEEVRRAVYRAIAATTPPELLDLSLIAPHDTWGGPARAAAERERPTEIATLVRVLGQLGAKKPSATWRRDVAEALLSDGAQRLLRAWLAAADNADPVPEWPDSEIGDCCGVLFIDGNEDLVRAAVWATCGVDDEWPSTVLGALATRGSWHNGMAGMTEALSLRVAVASIDALVVRGGPADRQMLQALFHGLQRRDLVRKVGAALDRPEEAERRAEQLARQKVVEQRRRAASRRRHPDLERAYELAWDEIEDEWDSSDEED